MAALVAAILEVLVLGIYGAWKTDALSSFTPAANASTTQSGQPADNQSTATTTTATPAPAAAPSGPLGQFSDPGASTASSGALTPQGTRAACWPAYTFDHIGGDAEAVNYLRGDDPRDTNDTYKVVVERDVAWLNANKVYYQYESGQTDADWHRGLTLVQIQDPVKVMNTYCPSGQKTVKNWKIQTLQPGEWVLYLNGHGPNDPDPRPVRKADCGNFLLPA